ncbi:arginine--tRNA ligase [Paenibacillus chondroitinus]|uniref:Arginine--tRNA ligase n=1 Tax=Paenibacillus chondroitinus TaxID=59842 RepID=A0ABU6DA87_9BACL|nr:MULTISPECIES: arginine--tRNA ligase [Paenibacillus]MCY9656939.1 arginine--tRNA ligase [Paenibacillus anseongense]MEB4794589.1 arginine--tRNA ligase [Paenibacillus chondroitinus]
MIQQLLTVEIEQHVEAMFQESGTQRPANLKILTEHPAHPEHGDYSSNIAMLLAKILRKSPLQIAGELQSRIEQNGLVQGLFSKAAAVAPGFLNFYINWEAWANGEFQAPTKRTSRSKQNKVLVEHTSINPNKAAHVGHLRNSCIGDSLSRMLSHAGYEVEVHNYIDDLGNQLADTVVGILHTQTEGSFPRFGDFCWETYAKVNQAYKDQPALAEQRSVVLHAIESGTSNLVWMGALVAERIVREQLEEMKQFGISYDVLVWESSIVRAGFWDTTFELLSKTEMFHKVTEGKLAGCWVLKNLEEGGAETPADYQDFQGDKVLVRSNGILTYTAKDIAYHLWKFGLLENDFVYKKWEDGLWSTAAQGSKKTIGRADMVINVIDYRQQYPQEMVKLALEVLGYQQQASQLKHVSYGVVSLSPDTAAGLGLDTSEGKSSYAMSGRQGIGIKVADLLDRMEKVIDDKRSRKAGISSRSIAAAAIRYYLLKYQLQTEVIFDLEQATEVTGNTGVYLLYAYARANRILDKAKVDDRLQAIAAKFHGTHLEDQEYQLLRHIAYWPETLENATAQLAPSLICHYAFELASLFNHFYSACPVLKGSEESISHRLWITQTVKATLHEALELLGMPTPKRL